MSAPAAYTICPQCRGAQYQITHDTGCELSEYENPVAPRWYPDEKCNKCAATSAQCTVCQGRQFLGLDRDDSLDLSVLKLFEWLKSRPVTLADYGEIKKYKAETIATEFGFVSMLNLAYPGAELVPGVVILDDYGDEDRTDDRTPDGWNPYATLCLHHWAETHSWFETGLVCVKKATRELSLLNHQRAESPVPLPLDLGGKRAFLVYQEGFPIYWKFPESGKHKGKSRPTLFAATDVLSLRVREDLYEKFPSRFRHFGAENWVSGPRVLLPLHDANKERQ